jgi:hypothetical protein
MLTYAAYADVCWHLCVSDAVVSVAAMHVRGDTRPHVDRPDARYSKVQILTQKALLARRARNNLVEAVLLRVCVYICVCIYVMYMLCVSRR